MEAVEVLTRDAETDRGCGVKEGDDLEAQFRWKCQQSDWDISLF